MAAVFFHENRYKLFVLYGLYANKNLRNNGDKIMLPVSHKFLNMSKTENVRSEDYRRRIMDLNSP